MTERTIAELASLIDRHAPGDGSRATAVEGLYLARARTSGESIPHVYEPSFCLVAQGRKRVLLADEVYDPASYLLASVALPVVAKIFEAASDQPFLGLRLRLDPSEIATLIAEVGPEGGRPVPGAPCRGLAVSPLGPDLLDAVIRLVALLDRPASIPILAPLIRREIAYHLLTGEQRVQFRQIAASDGPSRRVARAIQWLKSHYAEPLRIVELARLVALSPSALHHHFRAVTALSPLQYQKQLRLQEARRLLLTEDLDAAAVAVRVGYESASQFSREYRRLFGRPPRLDVQTLRAEENPALDLRQTPLSAAPVSSLSTRIPRNEDSAHVELQGQG